MAAVSRIMAWTSANARMLRRAAVLLGAMFVGGLLLLFWAPLAGLFVMLAAVLPVILMMLVAIAVLVRNETGAKRSQTEEGP